MSGRSKGTDTGGDPDGGAGSTPATRHLSTETIVGAVAETISVGRTNAENETIAISMPTEVRVLVFESIDGGWLLHVTAVAVDVDTKESGFFGTQSRWQKKPTREEIAGELDRWLAHEMREQLGLKPHATSTT